MHMHTLTRSLTALLLCCMVVVAAGCFPSGTRQPAPAQPTAATTTATIPTAALSGTPAPFHALPTNECLAAGDVSSPMSGQHYGINVFLFATDIERTLTLSDIAGFGWVRQQIHWRDIEGVRGRYIWEPLDQVVQRTREYDLRIMLSVVRSPQWATEGGDSGLPDDYAAFATFLRTLAERYRGTVSAYEIWNEPNLAHEHGGVPATPAEYLAVLQAAYPAVKQADPCALVLSAPLASTNNADPTLATDDLPFYEELYTLEDGAFLHLADAVAVHPGAGPNPPAAAWPADLPEQSHFYFRHIERVREIMQRHNDPRPVWITEVGWSVAAAKGAPQPVSEQQQADYLVDTLWFVRQHYPWVDAVFVWNLNFNVIAPASDEKSTFGILNPDWSIRPAFLALQHNVPGLRDIDTPPFIAHTAPLTRSAESATTYAWTFPGRGKMRSTPILTPDGTSYVVSDPGTLYAVSPSGILYWAYHAPGQVRSAPARSEQGMLYLAERGGLLIAVREDGSEAWRIRLRSPARGSPVVHGGMVYVATRNGEVQAFDSSGHEVWWHDVQSEAAPLALSDTPAADGKAALLVATVTGAVMRLEHSGATAWHTQLDGTVRAAPVPNGSGGAYVVTTAGMVVALDSSGQVRWQHDLQHPVVAAPLVGSDGRITIVGYHGIVSVLESVDGSVVWQFDTGSTLNASATQGTDGMRFIGTDDERLLAIDQSGALQWQAFVRGAIATAPAITTDGTLAVATMSGRLYTFTQDGTRQQEP